MSGPPASGLPNDLCTIDTCPLSQSFLNYSPNLAGNVLYLSIFAALLVAQLGLGIFYKTWGFLVGIVTGLALEVVGYSGRLIMRKNPFVIGNFLLYFIPTGLGPACICTSIYLLLARITVLYGDKSSYLRPGTYARIFCTLDFLALSIQGIGGGLTATADSPKSRDTSTYILIVGLAIQAGSLAAFLLLAGHVWRRVRVLNDEDMHQDIEVVKLRKSKNWKRFLIALALAAAFVFIRTVYRVVELSDGFTGALANDETSFMVLEGPMIILASLLLTVYHPGIVFRGGNWQKCDFFVVEPGRKWWGGKGRAKAGVNSMLSNQMSELEDQKIEQGQRAE